MKFSKIIVSLTLYFCICVIKACFIYTRLDGRAGCQDPIMAKLNVIADEYLTYNCSRAQRISLVFTLTVCGT